MAVDKLTEMEITDNPDTGIITRERVSNFEIYCILDTSLL